MHPSHSAVSRQQRRIRSEAGRSDSDAFFNLLTGEDLLDDVEALLPAHRERLFPPTETLSMFLAQVLSSDGSCRQAVDDAAVKRLVTGLPTCSTHTASYCAARARLPQAMIETLTRRTAEVMARDTPQWWLWRGRRVRLADGATVTLADTEANQAEYPQPSGQRAGLGFPILRMVALICLATGAVLDAATGACEGKGGDEQTLLREMLDHLSEGDILLGDAFYPTYFLLCELVRGGVDGVFEQYGARKRSTDFTIGKQLGAQDHLVTWTRPQRPDWMSPEEYEQIPETLTVREFYAGGKIMVTTFLCPKDAPKAMLKALYQRRWNVELDLRNIKTTLGMEHLRCMTPEMALKELWVYLLAYNLIRLLMAQAAFLADQTPRQLSFKHTVQIWNAWQQRAGADRDGVSMQCLLILIAQPRVGLRPGRVEPRARKRRPKNYPLLTKQREEAREEIRVHGHPKKQR